MRETLSKNAWVNLASYCTPVTISMADRLRDDDCLGAQAELGFVGLDGSPENPVAVAGYKAIKSASSPEVRRARIRCSEPLEHSLSVGSPI